MSSDYVIMVIHDEEAEDDPFDWDGNGPMGDAAYAVGLAVGTLTLGAYEPLWETFVWGVWTKGHNDWAGAYSSPDRIGDEYLREIARERRELRP